MNQDTSHSNSNDADMANLFKAPAARAIKSLERSLFSKTLPTAAALVKDNRLLSRYRKDLERADELLHLAKLSPIAQYAGQKDRKCFLLKPRVQVEDASTWSGVLREARDAGDIEVVPYTVEVDYSLWSYRECMAERAPGMDVSEVNAN